MAHDDTKPKMLSWAERHRDALSRNTLYGTGTTGGLLEEKLGLKIRCFRSGPLGGDAQLGALIANGKLDILVFFIDALSAQPHDVDVKMLTRLAVHYDTALALNVRTADALVHLFD